MAISTLSPSHPKYRPDIDGLRAIAVMGVVVYHAFPAWMKGGFIGVDVFFVISGFLITSIITKSLQSDVFKFSDFYIRRIKRIFPALLVVMLFTYLFGWLSLLSDEFRQLGKHIFSGATFISNLVLWSESGYFDNAAETKPLLHLWSLAVEEQFYIFWPVIIWGTLKIKRKLIYLISFLILLSFLLNIVTTFKDSSSAFYLPHTRFWELLVGSLLSIWFINNGEKFKNNSIRASGFYNVTSILGLMLLCYGFIFIDKTNLFPGFWALVPVLGAALLIISGPNAIINKLVLSNKVLVFIGLISFPIYLWHWPLLSFARIIETDVPSRSIRISAVFLSILLAYLTFIFVENPVRHNVKIKRIPIILVSIMIIFGLTGYITYKNDGFDFRKNATLKGFEGDIGHLDFHKFIAENYYLCTPEKIAKEALDWDGFKRCMQSKSNDNIDMVLLGDSHAEHLFLGLANSLSEKNIVFYIKGSPPFISNEEFNNIYNKILGDKNIGTVIINMYWFLRNNQVPQGSSLETELLNSIDALLNSGKVVYLTDDIPNYPFSPESCKGKRWLSSKESTCTIDLEDWEIQKSKYINTLEKITLLRNSVKLIETGKYLCSANTCSMTLDQKLLYRDPNHLNINGSLYIGQKIVDENKSLFD